MKKLYIFLMLLIATGLLAGCTGLFETTEATTMTFLTSRSSSTTTSNTINKDLILSDIYEHLYEDLYDDVKQEVIDSISEERFDEIYAQILAEIVSKIDSGDITVSSETIVDMIHAVEANAAKSVIGVSNLNENGVITAVGSGVIYKHVGNTYYVVTNNHVVEDGTSYQIRFEDGSTIGAVLRGVDSLVDLAVLYFISDDEYQVSDFADSDLVEKGDIVLAVGNPKGYDFYNSMTMGIVSGLDRFFDIDGDGVNDMFVNYIQHDAAINSGNSGGALFDINGDIIGINVIKFSATDIEGMGFAIPSNLTSAICSDIEEYGYSLQKPVLGIQFVELTTSSQTYFTTNEITIPDEVTYGFYVISVVVGASLDGYVQPGDFITQIGGINLTSSEDFVYYFQQYKVGDIISITLYRDGGFITIDNIELLAMVE
ncbi:MAG: trypsin-like peptidase domain-containing protein [Bacilli bacterium]|nr:trypsin-like peptidase domain-containing protein [Bacilli bacterium]MBN2877783.1 trypsin-like peptidase domain-containing protein [Bacilli bacterium]